LPMMAAARARDAAARAALASLPVAFDCPAGVSNLNQCGIIGHQEKEFYSDVPKGEVRQIKGVVILPNAPKPNGKFSWSYRVVAVKASSGSAADDLLAQWTRCGP